MARKVLRDVGGLLGRLRGGLRAMAVAPESAPQWLVALVAILPAVGVGLLLFPLPALEMLGVAVTAGVVAQVGGRLLKPPVDVNPVLPAVVGVALVGPGAPLAWAAAVAVLAGGGELARARFTPAARVQVGLVAYAIVLLASRGALAAYTNPGGTSPMPEPVRLWLAYYGPDQSPIDPVRLYVGNVAGPVFATSMLAVAIGAAWLWYSRRLSLVAILAFLLGALVPIRLMGWSAGYQLDSGPLWFVAALVLADRQTLPASGVGRPLLCFTAGLAAIAARARGYAIESALVTVAAMQLVVAGVEGSGWLVNNRQEVLARLKELRLSPRLAGRMRIS